MVVATLRNTPREETVKAYVTMKLENQMLGMPVSCVQDVLKNRMITPVPLTHECIAGVMNLRGRVVTAIDMRKRLGMPIVEHGPDDELTLVVVNYHEELYGLIVDKIGDVLNLPDNKIEHTPPHLKEHWKAIASGVYPMQDSLMVIVDPERLFVV
ncbi:chemotaxis protein CheW [bacterium]|nr:chemotaxis protein CheW [bacterium]